MKNGFTFIEILVVLIIISLISAFVVPRIVAPLGNLNLKTATRKVAGMLRYNRSKAVSEKINRVAVFDTKDRNLRTFSVKNIITASPDTDFKETQPDMVYALPEGVSFEAEIPGKDNISKSGFAVVFFPNGNSSGGVIIVSGDSGKRYSINIDAITGMVKIAQLERER